METILPYALGLAIFGLYILVMFIKEKRTRSRPPEHSCHQIQPCRCKSQTKGPDLRCQRKPDDVAQS